MKSQRIELLAPAKNAEMGMIAINHGADALYVGANYSARMAAGNPVHEIERLCRYAHLYGAKVYVALNTLLSESELEGASTLIHQLYEANVDALIIQDLSLLTLSLPPIPLHASTQCDIRTAERVQFFEQNNFERVILARELSLKQIESIRQHTSIELEAFVHGAVCVGYSGKCFISEFTNGRSANRGSCAQLCRLPYSLLNQNGEVLVQNKHLLSLKDMDRSAHLQSMLQAGITSFKIEGRLKDESYVKNVTAYYRSELDRLISGNPTYLHSSLGSVSIFFTSAPEKSFQRCASDFHLTKTNHKKLHINTSKSVGERIGKVLKFDKESLIIESDKVIANGDGMVFFNQRDELEGFRVNSVQGKRLNWHGESPALFEGAVLYRNFDHAFEKEIKHRSSERKLLIKMVLSDDENGFLLRVEDERGISAIAKIEATKEPAKQPEVAKANMIQQLQKLGNTIFKAEEVLIDTKDIFHIPASLLNGLRREAMDRLEENIVARHPKNRRVHTPITKEQALRYKDEFQLHPEQLLVSKYCIRGAYGFCSKRDGVDPEARFFLVRDGIKWEIFTDCEKCEMSLGV